MKIIKSIKAWAVSNKNLIIEDCNCTTCSRPFQSIVFDKKKAEKIKSKYLEIIPVLITLIKKK